MRILENFLTNIAGIRLGDSKKEETMSAVNQETLKPFLNKDRGRKSFNRRRSL